MLSCGSILKTTLVWITKRREATDDRGSTHAGVYATVTYYRYNERRRAEMWILTRHSLSIEEPTNIAPLGVLSPISAAVMGLQLSLCRYKYKACMLSLEFVRSSLQVTSVIREARLADGYVTELH